MINQLAKQIHDNAVKKGFWVDDNFAAKIMLVVTELSESVEAHRNNDYKAIDSKLYEYLKEIESNNYIFNETFKNKVKDGVFDEIADAIIRLLDISAHLNMDVEKHIEMKMQYNLGRGYLHGKEY